MVPVVAEWRATTVQACGLWPFSVGTATPMTGVPLGRHLLSGATVCGDPISWFRDAGLIPNPSVMLTGRPGLGKSTLVRRMALGLAATGTIPLVFGDLKPDYRNLVEALGGNVIQLGRGRGRLNILDPGATAAAANRLTGAARAALMADVAGRRLTVLSGLLALNRAGVVSDHEEAVLACALGVLDDAHDPGRATMHHLIDLLVAGPQAVRDITLANTDDGKYRQAVDPLVRSLTALAQGALGDIFAAETTTSIDLTKPLCIDISAISDTDEKLQAAVLLACWAEGFASISALQALTDAGLEPQHNFFVVLDELWRVLRAGSGLIDRIDALTRLDRNTGVGTCLVTHALKDLTAVGEVDRPKAVGFAERMGAHFICGVPAAEIPDMRQIVGLSDREAELITSWSTPDSWHTPPGGQRPPPPGLGKFLLKVGGRPGIPIQLQLTPAELSVNDTNHRWNTRNADTNNGR